MTAWPSHVDAKLFALVASGATLSHISACLHLPLSSVSVRAVEIGALAAADVPAVDTDRMPWPEDWLRPVAREQLAAQALRCRHLWVDVFRSTLMDELDEIARLDCQDPVALFLRGYLASPSAADVLFLAGLDADVVLPRLRKVARTYGLPALRGILAAALKAEAST